MFPTCSAAKDRKLINIPPKAIATSDERVVAVATMGERDRLVVHAGARHTTLRLKDIGNYLGQRAQRGRLLPRGFQKVDGLDIAQRS